MSQMSGMVHDMFSMGSGPESNFGDNLDSEKKNDGEKPKFKRAASARLGVNGPGGLPKAPKIGIMGITDPVNNEMLSPIPETGMHREKSGID